MHWLSLRQKYFSVFKISLTSIGGYMSTFFSLQRVLLKFPHSRGNMARRTMLSPENSPDNLSLSPYFMESSCTRSFPSKPVSAEEIRD